MQTLNILLAASNKHELRLLGQQLEQSKHRVAGYATNPGQAKLMYQQKRPDLAIISLNSKTSQYPSQVIRFIRDYLKSNGFMYLVFGPDPIDQLINRSAKRSILLPDHLGPIPTSPPAPEDWEWLNSFERFVDQHLAEITVPDLARAFAMSESTLLRQLKRLTGFTPTRYLQEARLHRSHCLLSARTYCSVHRIAAAVGYKNARAFARSYKKKYGQCPSVTLAG